MEEKLGANATFFSGILSHLRRGTDLLIFSTRPCVGQEKIQAKSLKTARFQSVRRTDLPNKFPLKNKKISYINAPIKYCSDCVYKK